MQYKAANMEPSKVIMCKTSEVICLSARGIAIYRVLSLTIDHNP